MEPYHLSSPDITIGIKLPTLQHRTSRPYSDCSETADILGISPHRVYLVSLQHYLYILSVALVLTFRWMGVTHYATLWCPDFPLPKIGNDKAVCGANLQHFKSFEKILMDSLTETFAEYATNFVNL